LVAAKKQAIVDKKNDIKWNFVLNMRLTQEGPNNIPTWRIKMKKPKTNENARQRVKNMSSMLMESKKSENADMTAVINCNIMQNRRRHSKINSFWGGRSERWEAIAPFPAAIIATIRSSATARMPNKIPKEYEEYVSPLGISLDCCESESKRSCIKDRIATCTPPANVACFFLLEWICQ